MHTGTIETPLKERWELQALEPCDVAGWRKKVRNELDERGYESDVAALVVSELLTNMLSHTRLRCGALCMEILEDEERHKRELFVGVSDHDPTMPTAALPQWRAECGRGMFLVKELSLFWDVTRTRNGKLVYALLPLRLASDDKDSGWGLTP